jgi:hypothetical protein
LCFFFLIFSPHRQLFLFISANSKQSPFKLGVSWPIQVPCVFFVIFSVATSPNRLQIILLIQVTVAAIFLFEGGAVFNGFFVISPFFHNLLSKSLLRPYHKNPYKT